MTVAILRLDEVAPGRALAGMTADDQKARKPKERTQEGKVLPHVRRTSSTVRAL